MKILNLNPETVALYKECFDNNGSFKVKENIEWQFFKNKEKYYVNIAFDETLNKPAAIYASFGVKFKIENQIYAASQTMDIITDVNYRGKGLFTDLAKNLYPEAYNNNIALMYAFPNGKSIHGFIKNLNWHKIDPLPFIIKPLKTKYFTDKISILKKLPNLPLSFKNYKEDKSIKIKIVDNFDKKVNELWAEFSKNIKIAVNRDKQYLDWRYIDKPNQNYIIANAYQNDKLVGFVVFVTKEKHNGKIGYIMEFIYLPENKKAAKQLLNFATTKIKNENADCILAWCLDHSPSYKTFSKKWFITLPEKIRPIELHFAYRVFNEKLKETIQNRKNWYISYSDSDTV